MIFSGLSYGLYLVANFTHQREEQFLWCIEGALSAGVDLVQLRAKRLNDEAFFILAQKVQILCEQFKKPFIVNDHAYIAKLLGAGLHLGEDDMSVSEARSLLGTKASIGQSVSLKHSDWPFLCTLADYISASPVFYTPTKPDGIYPCGLAGLNNLITKHILPIFAIGGIHEHNMHEVLDTGCRFVAVVSAIMNATDPFTETSKLRKILDERYGV